MTQCARALACTCTHIDKHTNIHTPTHIPHRKRGEEEMIQLYTINPTLKKDISKIC